MNPYYRDYADFLDGLFPGVKMQKLSVNAGFTCPNRDGTIGRGGCIYCNNQSFSPSYCNAHDPVAIQLEKGKRFFGRKYPDMRYLAYFQNYTNTYGGIEELLALYGEALSVEGVDGVVIGTRPDCIPEPLANALAGMNCHKGRVIVELGAESSHDITLRLINRGHTHRQTEEAAAMLKERGIAIGLHFIMGLPGESRRMMLDTIEAINRIKPSSVKFHQLQVLRGTRLHDAVVLGAMSVRMFDVEEYIDLCVEIIKRLDPSIAIERFVSQAPADMLVAPRWGLKNYQFTNLLHRRLKELRRTL